MSTPEHERRPERCEPGAAESFGGDKASISPITEIPEDVQSWIGSGRVEIRPLNHGLTAIIVLKPPPAPTLDDLEDWPSLDKLTADQRKALGLDRETSGDPS